MQGSLHQYTNIRHFFSQWAKHIFLCCDCWENTKIYLAPANYSTRTIIFVRYLMIKIRFLKNWHIFWNFAILIKIRLLISMNHGSLVDIMIYVTVSIAPIDCYELGIVVGTIMTEIRLSVYEAGILMAVGRTLPPLLLISLKVASVLYDLLSNLKYKTQISR